MRIVSAISRPLQGEHVLATDPPMKPILGDVWRKRINAFDGRSLSANALTDQQTSRIGHQRLMGQGVSPGPVRGLDVALIRETDPVDSTKTIADSILVHPGFGLCASGEDSVIQTPRQIRVMDLPVYLPVELRNKYFAGDDLLAQPEPPTSGAINGAPGLAGLLVRCMMSKLSDIAAKDVPDIPHVAVLVAEPIVLEATARGNPDDPCPRDPRDDPYDDLRNIDGTRLSLYLWPSEVLKKDVNLDIPDYGLPAKNLSFRNELVHKIFSIERGFILDDAHPWENLGIPLGLLSFDEKWRVEFLDCASVVRVGGQPRPRSPLVRQAGTQFLWQARISQFMEHLAELHYQGVKTEDLPDHLPKLPPVGLLPASVFSPQNRTQNFFPPGFKVHIVPAPLEQIEIVVRESASLRPVELSVPEDVELIVPVPERLYEPELLLTAEVDEIFQASIERFQHVRSNWLAARERVRRRKDILVEAITGSRTSYPARDAEESTAERDKAQGMGRSHTVSGAATHSFSGAKSTLDIRKGDSLFLWVKTNDKITNLSFQLTGKDPADSKKEVTLPLPRPQDLSLPSTNVWTKLVVLADLFIDTLIPKADTFTISGMIFGQNKDGIAEWGSIGKIDAAGIETVYVSEDVPQGGITKIDNVDAPWKWTAAAPPPLVDDFGTAQSGDERNAVALIDFNARYMGNGLFKTDLSQLIRDGFDGFTAAIEAKLKITNDKIDFGFVRARTDIYRVRQFMLGNDAASRLVTSPAIADIASRDEGARATGERIKDFVKDAFNTKAQRDPNDPTRLVDAASPAPPPPSGVTETSPISPTIREASIASSSFSSPFRAGPRIGTATPGIASFAETALVQPGLTNVFSRASIDSTTLLQPSAIERPALLTNLGLEKSQLSIAGMSAATAAINFSGSDVRDQQPLIGYTERTLSVAERLRAPPAISTYDYALAGKKLAISSLTALIDGSEQAGIFLDDIEVPGTSVGRADNKTSAATLIEIISKKDASGNKITITDIDLVADSPDRHEADYFGAAVKSIDNTISLMRLVEGRIAAYGKILEDAKTAKASLLEWLGKADARLRTIEVELAEARHDVSVATALLAEEETRIKDLNDKRSFILRDHVKLLVFRRPRTVNRVVAIPVANVSPALAEKPVSMCLREHPGVPGELRQMAEGFRHAPMAWFPNLHPVLELFDRPEFMAAALMHVKNRASLPLPIMSAPAAFAGAKYLNAMNKSVFVRDQQFAVKRAFGRSLEPALINVEGLVASRNRLKSVALVSDLIDSGHGRAEASRRAAEELDGIAQTAACLHASFADVKPLTRLAWAELLSEFDAPVPLRSLTALPNWVNLPVDQRREQQGLADFLYSRIDTSNAEAVAAIDDLIRAALLMAAHAPVDKLVAARVARPAPVRPGTLFDLQVNVASIRIGMAVTVHTGIGDVLAHAIVEDVANGLAKARITAAVNPAAIMNTTSIVHLSETPVVKITKFPSFLGK